MNNAWNCNVRIISKYVNTLWHYVCWYRSYVSSLAWKRLKTPSAIKQMKEDGLRVGGEREREREREREQEKSQDLLHHHWGLQTPAGAHYRLPPTHTHTQTHTWESIWYRNAYIREYLGISMLSRMLKPF